MGDTDVQVTNSTNEELTEETLSSMFDKSLEFHSTIEQDEDSTSEKYKIGIKSGITRLEDVTSKVNILGLFSSNETIEEVATADLKYLLLPALLGSFTLKRNTTVPEERVEILSLAELYFEDYLKRYKDYEVSDIKCSVDSSHKEDDVQSAKLFACPQGLQAMMRQREQKIAHFKRLKALGEKEKDLYCLVKAKKDDEVLREYFIVMLKKWALIASEELEKLKTEKEILKHAPQGKRPQKDEKSQEKPKPLKPVIITRNEMQKKMYGLGYPSVPVMTVDEFYEQRYPEQAEKGPVSAAEMSNLMYMAENPEFHKKQLELEDEEKERKIENDDPELLKHSRGFDDWKDVNRRGCGNRKNKG